MKVATNSGIYVDWHDAISTHATNEGSDMLMEHERLKATISTHATNEGSDTEDYVTARDADISTHATNEGSDCEKRII